MSIKLFRYFYARVYGKYLELRLDRIMAKISMLIDKAERPISSRMANQYFELGQLVMELRAKSRAVIQTIIDQK